MMRPGDKLKSYRLLAEALLAVSDLPWHLLVIGDGEANAETRQAFGSLPQGRVRFLGALDGDILPPLAEVKVGRNDPCPCGSGKKFKKCCG